MHFTKNLFSYFNSGFFVVVGQKVKIDFIQGQNILLKGCLFIRIYFDSYLSNGMSRTKTIFVHPFLSSTITISLAIDIVPLFSEEVSFMFFSNPTITTITHSCPKVVVTAITAGIV